MPRRARPTTNVPIARDVFPRLAELPGHITIAEASAFSRLCRRTIERDIELGRMTTVKVRHRRMIPRDAFETWLSARIEVNAARRPNPRARASNDRRSNAVTTAARDVLSVDLEFDDNENDLYVPITDLRLALERAYAFGKRDGAANRRPNARRSA